jgi:hypothetical protein
LQQADVLGHEEEDEDDGEHGGDACTEETPVKKVDTGKMIKPLTKHIF